MVDIFSRLVLTGGEWRRDDEDDQIEVVKLWRNKVLTKVVVSS